MSELLKYLTYGTDAEFVADLLDELKDRIEFQKNNGVDYDMMCLVDKMCLTEIQKQRIYSFKKNNSFLIDAIYESQFMQRLHGITNVTLKIAPHYYNKLTSDVVTNKVSVLTPPIITRFMHSNRVADLCLIIGVKVELEDRDLFYVYFAGLLHDIRHSALSHEGDDFLKYHGVPDHEERGFEYLRKSFFFINIFDKEVIEKIISIISESDPLGTILSIADTSSYMVSDLKSYHLSTTDDIVIKAVNNSIKYDKEKGIWINDNFVKELAQLRFYLYKNIYCSLINKIRHSAIVNLLKLMTYYKNISLEDIAINYSDNEIYHCIQSISNDFPRNKLSHIFDILYGIYLNFTDVRKSSEWNMKITNLHKINNIIKTKPNAISANNFFSYYFQIPLPSNALMLFTFPSKLHKVFNVNGENITYNEPCFEAEHNTCIMYWHKSLNKYLWNIEYFLKNTS